MERGDGHGPAHKSDPHRAPAGTQDGRVPLRLRVLRVYAEAGDDGCTMDEVLQRLSHELPASVSPRSRELLDSGFIEDTELTRPTRRQMHAGVRRITPAGLARLQQLAA